MVKITVSNDNFNKIINAKSNEEIRIEHMNLSGSVRLRKECFIRKLTMAQVEAELGCAIELIGAESTISAQDANTVIPPERAYGSVCHPREINDKYESAIYDAERRIGSYIAGGGKSEDIYVKDQIKKIRIWTEEIKA